jgi:hypothetical protein
LILFGGVVQIEFTQVLEPLDDVVRFSWFLATPAEGGIGQASLENRRINGRLKELVPRDAQDEAKEIAAHWHQFFVPHFNDWVSE